MNMKKLTFPCIILLAALAVSPLLAQEQHAEAGADQAVSADSAQPADTAATPPPRAASPSVQPAGEAGANAEAARPSAAAAPKPAVKAETAAAEKNQRKDIQAKEAAAPQAGSGLLDVNDEEYRYARIPGMPPVRKTDSSQAVSSDEMTAENPSVAQSDAGKDTGGLFGLSKETGDTLTRVALVLLIAVIFILYRFRSRGGGRRVARSYPKR